MNHLLILFGQGIEHNFLLDFWDFTGLKKTLKCISRILTEAYIYQEHQIDEQLP